MGNIGSGDFWTKSWDLWSYYDWPNHKDVTNLHRL